MKILVFAFMLAARLEDALHALRPAVLPFLGKIFPASPGRKNSAAEKKKFGTLLNWTF
jgi:hypothetical protein